MSADIACPACATEHAIYRERAEQYRIAYVAVVEVGTCDPADGGWQCDCGHLIPDAEVEATVRAIDEERELARAGVY